MLNNPPNFVDFGDVLFYWGLRKSALASYPCDCQRPKELDEECQDQCSGLGGDVGKWAVWAGGCPKPHLFLFFTSFYKKVLEGGEIGNHQPHFC